MTVRLRRKPAAIVLREAALYAQEVLLETAPRLKSSDPLYKMVALAAVRLAVALDHSENSR